MLKNIEIKGRSIIFTIFRAYLAFLHKKGTKIRKNEGKRELEKFYLNLTRKGLETFYP